MEKGKYVSWGKTANPVQLLLSVSFNALEGGCAGKMLYSITGLFTPASAEPGEPCPSRT